MSWAPVVVLLILTVIVIWWQTKTDLKRSKAFQRVFEAEASKVGFNVWRPHGTIKVDEALGELFGIVKLPKDRYVVIGPTGYGVFQGWKFGIQNFSYTSNPTVSHTGSGYQVYSFAVALSNPSRELPRFRSDSNRKAFENLGYKEPNDITLERLRSRRREGYSDQCDGKWLVVEGSGGLTPSASNLENFIKLADFIADGYRSTD